MTNRKETPSRTGKAIRDRINAIIGINRHSNYEVARIIDKSERYVRVHRKGDLEWSLGMLNDTGRPPATRQAKSWRTRSQ